MKSKLYLFASCFSLIAGWAIAPLEAEIPVCLDVTQREQDLTVILNQSYFKDGTFDKLAAVFAARVLENSDRSMPIDDVIARLRQAMETDEVRQELMKPFAVFSDEEIHQIRQLNENEVFLKYMKESFPIAKSNVEVMTKVIESILQQYGQVPAAVNSAQNSKIVEVTSDNFQQEIEQATKPVVVDVYANWCGACRAFAPIFDSVSQSNETNCKFAKIDFTRDPQLAKNLNVVFLPTILFMYKGQIISRSEGLMTKEEFEAKIQAFMTQVQACNH